VSCAAALATLDIFDRENVFSAGRQLSPYFLDGLFQLKSIPGVTDIRGYGMLAAIDIAPGAVPGQRGYRLQKRLFESGLHLKTTGDCVTVAPQLVATRAQIDELLAILEQVLTAADF
jgi:beta-alanine--pyruvate transaminase